MTAVCVFGRFAGWSQQIIICVHIPVAGWTAAATHYSFEVRLVEASARQRWSAHADAARDERRLVSRNRILIHREASKLSSVCSRSGSR